MNMDLTPDQLDILTEIINIGFGRAAASLSSLVGQRVILEMPQVKLLPLEQFHHELASLFQDQLAIVHQSFQGSLTGDGLLLIDFNSATVLIDLLSGEEGVPRRLMHSDREALIEVGNILLNAYLGSLGNLLKLSLKFSLPDLQLETMERVLDPYLIPELNKPYALLVRTDFRFHDNQVIGYVALIIALDSLWSFLQSLDQVTTPF